jgi:hypothetical protein
MKIQIKDSEIIYVRSVKNKEYKLGLYKIHDIFITHEFCPFMERMS